MFVSLIISMEFFVSVCYLFYSTQLFYPEYTLRAGTLEYIHEIPRGLDLSENILKYADDLDIYSTITKAHSSTISRGNQLTANQVIAQEAAMSAQWCQNNGMALNTSKPSRW